MAKILLVQGVFCARIELANDDFQGRRPGEENVAKDRWRLSGNGSLPPDQTISRRARIATPKNKKDR